MLIVNSQIDRTRIGKRTSDLHYYPYLKKRLICRENAGILASVVNCNKGFYDINMTPHRLRPT